MIQMLRHPLYCLLLLLSGSNLFAASGGGEESHGLNWYAYALEHWFGIHFDSAVAMEWLAVPPTILLVLTLLVIGICYRSYARSFDSNPAPDGKWSPMFFVHGIIEYVFNLAKDIIGHDFKRYLPLLLTIFLFVLVGNLEGMVPGMGAATGFISANLALGLSVFVIYNIAGVKEHGGSYIKQFTGPFTSGPGLILAVMFLVIELISHAARPASLSMRLMINVFADHMILDIFTDLTYLVIPALLAFFGLLVAFVQSFVFTLLSGIYISMAVSHDH